MDLQDGTLDFATALNGGVSAVLRENNLSRPEKSACLAARLDALVASRCGIVPVVLDTRAGSGK